MRGTVLNMFSFFFFLVFIYQHLVAFRFDHSEGAYVCDGKDRGGLVHHPYLSPNKVWELLLDWYVPAVVFIVSRDGELACCGVGELCGRLLVLRGGGNECCGHR